MRGDYRAFITGNSPFASMPARLRQSIRSCLVSEQRNAEQALNLEEAVTLRVG